ncbi:MAG: hypothetical protein GWM90_30450 [Gemmatimonadetes bacterium]|nr:hypothetical protein [Gemmatimonadota bacterium]NIQ59475.1 hypothetical protein [Gemmatimonadota bacterium]NIU79670.1 hypothetical protein [Gammaproteobacteria bacterium]NIX48226.1 hypothetical protein [Gemmatimonadota bacterium]NIY12662.1 hypothetical protein [Gemmatimonadota bacterium]
MTSIEAIMSGILGTLLILTPAAVILLRPVFRRLGDYLEAAAAEKRRGANGRELTEMRAALERFESRLTLTEERLDSRLSLTEERVDFQEKLLSDRNAGAPGSAGGQKGPVAS